MKGRAFAETLNVFLKEDHEKYREELRQANSLSRQDLVEKYSASQLPCDFDRENMKSPCYFKQCQIDDNDLKCLRYLLDYCGEFQDRGCIIQLPHLLNKLGKSEYKVLKTMETDFS